MSDSFGARATLDAGGAEYEIFRLDSLQERFDVARLPYSLKVLLENALRLEDGDSVTSDDVEALASWDANAEPSVEIPDRTPNPPSLLRKREWRCRGESETARVQFCT